MKKLIMCDLDNTLLPIYTQEKFAEMWFRDIAAVFAAHGMDPAVAVPAMDKGCRAMILNNGEMNNLDRFFDAACACSGYTRAQMEPVMDEYYAGSFANVRQITLPNPYAPEIARLMRARAQYAVIATMPIFPIKACDMRMSWVGLSADMFDLVTTCDFSSFSKPNPLYYDELLRRFGVQASEALMIGNDVREDMEPCESLGIDAFLVTDHIITHGLDYSRFRRGSYPELIEYLNEV